jgi:hypothetical protein
MELVSEPDIPLELVCVFPCINVTTNMACAVVVALTGIFFIAHSVSLCYSFVRCSIFACRMFFTLFSTL